MATKAERGTKRTCQNGSCGARFYDLNRSPIVCPMCSHPYVVAVTAPSAGEGESVRRAGKKPEFVAPPVADAVADGAAEGDDVLVEVEEAGEAAAAGEEETFLETEEDEGGDVSGIIGGTAAEGDEEA